MSRDGGYVHKLDRGMGHLAGLDQVGKLVQTLVRDLGHADVGIAGVEGMRVEMNVGEDLE
jgi:hypothetical protein